MNDDYYNQFLQREAEKRGEALSLDEKMAPTNQELPNTRSQRERKKVSYSQRLRNHFNGQTEPA
jgi:hypothetical protein